MKVQVVLVLVCLGGLVAASSTEEDVEDTPLSEVDWEEKINEYRRTFGSSSLVGGIIGSLGSAASEFLSGAGGENGFLNQLIAIGAHGVSVATKEAGVGFVNLFSKDGHTRAQTWPGQCVHRIVKWIAKPCLGDQLASKFARIAQEFTDRLVAGFYEFLLLPDSLVEKPKKASHNHNHPKRNKPHPYPQQSQQKLEVISLPRYQVGYGQLRGRLTAD